ncbi:MAG: hypothetical protein ACYTFT_13460 [Planctomycetota bacterium]|jgi:hypothetical protein
MASKTLARARRSARTWWFIAAPTNREATFADGTVGVLLAYVMPAPNDLEIAQLQALRIDGDTATSLTISTERAQLSEELKATYLEALASARIDPDGQ